MEVWQRRRLRRSLVMLVGIIALLIYAWFRQPMPYTAPSGRPDALAKPVAGSQDWQVTPLVDATYLPALLAEIDGAQKSVDVAMYVIRTDAGQGAVSRIIEALRAAKRRSVAVHVLLDRSLTGTDNHDRLNRRAAALLRAAGADVRYDRPEIELHDKLVIIDGVSVLLGAHNWTVDALEENHELSLRIRSAAHLREFNDEWEALWQSGKEFAEEDPSSSSGEEIPGAVLEPAE